jgi:hypothetical protein
MSLSNYISDYAFGSYPDLDYGYDREEVEQKLNEWAELARRLERRVDLLESKERLLHALEAEGVDNWEGYEGALDRLEDEDN